MRAGLISRLCLIALGVGCGRCATDQKRDETTTPGANHQHAPRAAVHASLEPLVASVRSLDAEPASFRSKMLSAFWRLAAALDGLPSPAWEDDNAIRDAARQLEASDASPARTELVKHGLRAALRALAVRTPPAGLDAPYACGLQTFTQSIEALHEDSPIADERAGISKSFRAGTDLLSLAAGTGTRFDEAGACGDAGVPSAILDTSEALRRARRTIFELGQASWSDQGNAAAQSLRALADVVAAADCKEQLASTTASIRLQATKLALGGGYHFDRSDWVKDGISSALDSLQHLNLDSPQADVSFAAARKAVGGIDASRPMTFQRAAIQDAFRATVDAFALALHFAKPCR